MVNTTTPAASKLACDIIRDHLGALAEVRRSAAVLLCEASLTCSHPLSVWAALSCTMDGKRWPS